MINFSDEEHALISRAAGIKRDIWDYLSFYASILIPFTSFAVYGLIQGNIISIAISFAGLLMFELWQIRQNYKSAKVFRSICTKLQNK